MASWAASQEARGSSMVTGDLRWIGMSGLSDSGSDAFCAGEMRRQELSGSVERRGPFVEDRGIGLEDVGHPTGDVEDDLDVGGDGLTREADGVVEENLVTSGLDDQGRQAGQVGEYGADEAESGVLSGRVVGDSGLEVFSAHQRV